MRPGSNMMSTSNKLVLAGLDSLSLLSGCGGGDESSGSATEFSIVPATVTVKGADASAAYNIFTVEPRSFQDYMIYGPVPFSEVLKFSNLKQNKGWR